MSWPMKAAHPTTHHAADNKIPRAHLAGDWGWCSLCEHDDVQGVAYATWQDPISGDRVQIVVCEGHKGHPDIVPGSCREAR